MTSVREPGNGGLGDIVSGMRQKKQTKTGGRNIGLGVDPLGSNSEIGRKLKEYYDELVSPEIPDRFSQLLQELEKLEEPQTVSEE